MPSTPTEHACGFLWKGYSWQSTYRLTSYELYSASYRSRLKIEFSFDEEDQTKIFHAQTVFLLTSKREKNI
jgi:hypothetical protein